MVGAHPRLREEFEPFGERHEPIEVTVVVRAVGFLAVGAVLALLDLELFRVILLLLPAVRKHALVLVGAALRVRSDRFVHAPVGAHLALVDKCGRPATEVLPVVGVDADFAVVVIFPIRTPHSLEVEHVEVHVYLVLLDQLYGKFALVVRERTVLLVFARRAPHLEIRRAELGLVLVWVIEFFNTVMRSLTVVLLRAILVLAGHVRTDLRLVSTEWPPPVFVIVVVEWAALQVVILGLLLALVNFEGKEVQKHYALAHTDRPSVEPPAVQASVGPGASCVAGRARGWATAAHEDTAVENLRWASRLALAKLLLIVVWNLMLGFIR